MSVSVAASGSQAATVTTEHQLADTAATGVYQFVVDTQPMLAGDVLELRIYQMTLTSGTSRVLHFGVFYGAQVADDYIKTSVPVTNPLTDSTALRFSLKQTFGTSRTFPWSLNKVAS